MVIVFTIYDRTFVFMSTPIPVYFVFMSTPIPVYSRYDSLQARLLELEKWPFLFKNVFMPVIG